MRLVEWIRTVFIVITLLFLVAAAAIAVSGTMAHHEPGRNLRTYDLVCGTTFVFALIAAVITAMCHGVAFFLRGRKQVPFKIHQG